MEVNIQCRGWYGVLAFGLALYGLVSLSIDLFQLL